ncbi:ETC complex I subunit [Phaeovulum sp.]|uniref:ETC complex I subunit n=1 Tax=Phaeovulum sp. TaxID=2934796 RepID=UPI0039E32F19
MRARIYQPARNVMQSGTAKTKAWVLDFAPAEARDIDPLMGWTSSGDTQTQVRLSFDSCESAVAYAKENGISYSVAQPNKRQPNVRARGYGENFSTDRRFAWTH